MRIVLENKVLTYKAWIQQNKAKHGLICLATNEQTFQEYPSQQAGS